MKMSDEVKVSLVTAVCVLSLAIVSKNILSAQIDLISLYGPVGVFIIYIITKDSVKNSKIYSNPLFWSLAIIVVTAAILILYAI
jgi:hypothetical protein